MSNAKFMKGSVALALSIVGATALEAAPGTVRPSEADIIKNSAPADWRPLAPENTLVMELRGTQVLIELAPRFAPRHAENVRALARNGYYTRSAIVRVQDNFVTQWADPNESNPTLALPLGDAKDKLPAEFSIPLNGLPIDRLADTDGWAPLTGWVDGMPVAADAAANKAWIAHCYGTVGAGRNNAPDSSNASSLYVIIGQAPRRLDLNITVVGRVLKGMEALSSLPRGPAPMGFYEKPEMHVPMGPVRLLADIPVSERPSLEIMRTDTAAWRALVEASRNPVNPWFTYQPGHTTICNRSVPTRPAAPA